MPLLVTSTLAGFTSKCSTFLWWQWTRALVTQRRRKINLLTALRHSQPEQQPPRDNPCLNVSPFSRQGGGEGSSSQHTPWWWWHVSAPPHTRQTPSPHSHDRERASTLKCDDFLRPIKSWCTHLTEWGSLSKDFFLLAVASDSITFTATWGGGIIKVIAFKANNRKDELLVRPDKSLSSFH